MQGCHIEMAGTLTINDKETHGGGLPQTDISERAPISRVSRT